MSIFESFFGQDKNGKGKKEKEKEKDLRSDRKEQLEREEFLSKRDFFKRTFVKSRTPREIVEYEKDEMNYFLERNSHGEDDKQFLLSKMTELEDATIKMTKVIRDLLDNDVSSYEDLKEYFLLDGKVCSIRNDISSFYFKKRL